MEFIHGAVYCGIRALIEIINAMPTEFVFEEALFEVPLYKDYGAAGCF